MLHNSEQIGAWVQGAIGSEDGGEIGCRHLGGIHEILAGLEARQRETPLAAFYIGDVDDGFTAASTGGEQAHRGEVARSEVGVDGESPFIAT